MVASRPVVMGTVEQKVCEDCGVQFFRGADAPKKQRDRYCKKCRQSLKPVQSAKRLWPPRLQGNKNQ